MSCDRIRPILYRLVEQEAEPAEAIDAARHLSRCTACKILLAREHRLAHLLENDLVDLPVDDEFVAAVMSTLPEGPPPRPARARVLRGMKLACLAGMLLLAGQPQVARLAPFGADGLPVAMPSFAAENADLGRYVLPDAVGIVAAAAAPLLEAPLPVLRALVLGFGAALVAALAGSSLLALAAGSWLGFRGYGIRSGRATCRVARSC